MRIIKEDEITGRTYAGKVSAEDTDPAGFGGATRQPERFRALLRMLTALKVLVFNRVNCLESAIDAVESDCCTCNVVRWENPLMPTVEAIWHQLKFQTQIIAGSGADNSWMFTAPRTATYDVTLYLRGTLQGMATLTRAEVALVKDGTWYSFLDQDPAAGTQTLRLQGCDSVQLDAGQTLDIRIRHAGGMVNPGDFFKFYGYVVVRDGGSCGVQTAGTVDTFTE